MKPTLFALSLIAGLVLAPLAPALGASGEDPEVMPQFGSDQVTGPITLRDAVYVDGDVIHLGERAFVKFALARPVTRNPASPRTKSTPEDKESSPSWV